MISIGDTLNVLHGNKRIGIPIRAELKVVSIATPPDNGGITDVTVQYNGKPRTLTVRHVNRLSDEFVQLRHAWRPEHKITVAIKPSHAVVTRSGSQTLPVRAAEMGLTLRTTTVRCNHCASRHDHGSFHSLGVIEAQASARLAGYKSNCDGWACPGCVAKGFA